MSSSRPGFFGGVRRAGFGDSIAAEERGIYAASWCECMQILYKFERFAHGVVEAGASRHCPRGAAFRPLQGPGGMDETIGLLA